MKNHIILTKKNKSVNGTVHLTGSKSECNRALIIEALSNGRVKVENISDAADAVTLAGVLRGNKKVQDYKGSMTFEINVGPAGTAMRFLTAYLAIQNTEIVLT